LLVLGISAVIFGYKTSIRPVDLNNETIQDITIDKGSSENDISRTLKDNGLINSSFWYQMYTRINRVSGETQAGVYELSPSMSVSDIVNKLTNGDVKVNLMTILPGQRLEDIKQVFLKKGYTLEEIDSAMDPMNYVNHPALVNKPKSATLEGYLYPESFQYTSTTPLRAIIESSLDKMAELFTPEIKQKLQEEGLSLHQAVTLASIVEKEVSKNEDKPTVAQVFLTRYSRGIALGSDVTAFYGASLVGKDESVSTDTIYNTRIHSGLPPGPISNVSMDSLLAVANPSTTDYLYFVVR